MEHRFRKRENKMAQSSKMERHYEEAREVVMDYLCVGESSTCEYRDSSPFGGRFADYARDAREDSRRMEGNAFVAVRVIGGMILIAQGGKLRRGKLGVC